MATVGLDCHLILDGQGYWIAAASFHCMRPRVRRSTVRQDGTVAYVDLGPGRKQWRFTVVAMDGLRDVSGGTVTTSGAAYRAALIASFAKINQVLSFVDPEGKTYQVRFDACEEVLPSLRSQLTGIGYELAVTLVEA